MGLGDIPGGGFESVALGVSPDGSVAVGLSQSVVARSEGFRWEDGVIEGVGDLPGGILRSQANAASEGGSVVVGSGADSSSVLQAIRWEDGVLEVLEFIVPPPTAYSAAADITPDGHVIVGSCTDATQNFRAVRWNDGAIEVLSGIPGGTTESFATAISADGRVIVGVINVGIGQQAYRWVDGVFEPLGDSPGGISDSRAMDVSADGRIIVGRGVAENGYQAFRWENEVVEPLGDLEGGSLYSEAFAVSGDGQVIVGSGHSADGEEAFIWDRETGIRPIKEVLEADYGLDLTGWALTRATGVSDDGRTIVGTGTNPNGFREGWITDFPGDVSAIEIDVRPWSRRNIIHPGSRGVVPVLLLGSDDFDAGDVDLGSLAFGSGDAGLEFRRRTRVFDSNRDGFVDLLVRFRTQETGIEAGDEEACVTGETIDGRSFEGCDAVITLLK